MGRKPWPGEMDEWTHPRRSAARLPPRATASWPRPPVRWVAGGEAEVRGMVTAAGRNFYAGVLARDGFNGLRALAARHGFALRRAVHDEEPEANSRRPLPAAAGCSPSGSRSSSRRTLPASRWPSIPMQLAARRALFDQGIWSPSPATRCGPSMPIRASSSGRFPASDPRYVVAGDGTVAARPGPAPPQRNGRGGGTRHGERPRPLEAERRHGCRKRREQSTTADWWRSRSPRSGNEGPENALHILSAADGKVQLDYPFLPGIDHRRQARVFADDRLWLLHGSKDADKQRFPSRFRRSTPEAAVLVTHPAGLTHFPPVKLVATCSRASSTTATGRSTPTGSPRPLAAAATAGCRPTV